MRPLVNVREDHARITPGEAFRAHVDVRNAGTIVETYDLIALGPAAPWVEIEPSSLSLFPGEEGTAVVTMRPPLSPSVVAGDYMVGIQAMSQVRRENASSDELLASVAPFYRFTTSIGRNSFSIRTKAKLLVQVTNEGNSTVAYQIDAFWSRPRRALSARVSTREHSRPRSRPFAMPTPECRSSTRT